MKMFTYIEGGYKNFSIGFWEGMEICTWNFIYPPHTTQPRLNDVSLYGVSVYLKIKKSSISI